MASLKGTIWNAYGQPMATRVRFTRVTGALSSGNNAIQPEYVDCISRPDGNFSVALPVGVWQTTINGVTSLQVTLAQDREYTVQEAATNTVVPGPLPGAYLPLAGGTMVGPLVLMGDPTAPLHPATMQWALASFALLAHSHTWGDVSKSGASLADLPTRNFSDLQNKPTTLGGYGIVDAAPLVHGHAWADVSKTGSSLGDLATRNFSDLQNLPTTLAGYGITDAAPLVHTHSFASLTSKPTTLSGYGITDAEPTISGGTTGQYWRGDKSWQTLNKSAVGLGDVENTALSTWNGSSNLTTVGTIVSGTWNGSQIGAAYLASHTHSWSEVSKSGASLADLPTRSFSDLQSKPTTLGGYGITDAEPSISGGTTGQYWRGDKSWQTLNKAAVGLGNVENTALSTWSGSSSIQTVGTINFGTWQGTAIDATYLGSHQHAATDITSGTLPIARGGTGQTTANTALNALLPSQSGQSGKVLKSNGTDAAWQDDTGEGFTYEDSITGISSISAEFTQKIEVHVPGLGNVYIPVQVI